MTKETYIAELETLKNKHKVELNQLHIAYAKEQRKYKVGDIIREYETTIRITRIQTDFDFNKIPHPIYCGVRVKKDLTDMKSGEIGWIYASENKSNIILIKSLEIPK